MPETCKAGTAVTFSKASRAVLVAESVLNLTNRDLEGTFIAHAMHQNLKQILCQRPLDFAPPNLVLDPKYIQTLMAGEV